MIQTGEGTLCSKIHEFIMSVWNNEQLPQQWKRSVTVPVYEKGQ
jgi:hypothetical protein